MSRLQQEAEMSAPNLILPFPDYRRMFRVIFSFLDGSAHIHRACTFFAVAGAHLIQRFYRYDAAPVSGAAAYMVSAEKRIVATFGKIEQGALVPAPDAFHCWIECQGYAIDFMAPVFRENLEALGLQHAIARKVFQRPLAAMESSLAALSYEGAFSLVRDAECTKAMHATFNSRPIYNDLANLCAHWYRRPPTRISKSIATADKHGRVMHLMLHGPEIAGVW